ncbi:MAG: hypothetical protein P9X22_09520 [Candidatus Zapsychrus exili]|nr:hypothetical protein [Candidatus Zapsychrus exili]
MSTIQKNLVLVILCSLIISIALGCLIWNMNFWPTDAEDYYFPATLRIPELKHISEIHNYTNLLWLHSKEMFLLLVSDVQRIMGDLVTLRPFIVVCLFSFFIASVLIYLIAYKIWNVKSAWITYLVFVTSYWPYVYILFIRHQITGLMFVLIAIALLLFASKKSVLKYTCYVLSGASLGCAFFASITSAAYIPFCFAVFLYKFFILDKEEKGGISYRESIEFIICAFLGFLAAFIYFTYPTALGSLSGSMSYINTASDNNHFYYNQPVLQQWIKTDIAQTNGGWFWIFKFLMITMPVLFPLYCICLVYFIYKCAFSYLKDKVILYRTIGVIVLSFIVPFVLEFKKIAQCGTTFFPTMLGIVFMIGYSGYIFLKEDSKIIGKFLPKKSLQVLVIIVFLLHIALNAYAFFSDAYPTRMATHFLSNKMEKLGISQIYTYKKHPHRSVMIDCLNPSLKEKLKVVDINHILEPKEGYILIPPTTKDSIYLAAHSDYAQFDDDIFLNELIRKGNLADYAVCSFPTLVSSFIWSLEQETLAHRYLMLNQFSKNKKYLGRVWLLDAAKLQRDKRKNVPSKEYIHLVKDDVRNIGTKEKVYLYKGIMDIVNNPSNMKSLVTRIYKVGNPTDGLVAYLYSLDIKAPVWVLSKEKNGSYPIKASEITSNPNGGLTIFKFKQPFWQEIGPYRIKIYRTGKEDDKNYYRIYTKFQKRVGE